MSPFLEVQSAKNQVHRFCFDTRLADFDHRKEYGDTEVHKTKILSDCPRTWDLLPDNLTKKAGSFLKAAEARQDGPYSTDQ